ncbi:P-loop containing nucleoside triphosphate hydrolase protein [Microdochium trichocladiopsis]|uniref:RNA helicase n=1 Tax=Microdochium trichocladiopsis TaxID=1682393 RepID=A0A9P8YJ35_9PEZI|nr:P-loop containing nucleoside triphosphate hydrolase protein [Microdochium trichocladiopsis]KAH7041436.1 P-loop containing nucleoside triphosphate hydrolase protein [Microdochium trichocladiopsis]
MSKRKIEDDFVYTLSDNDDAGVEEEGGASGAAAAGEQPPKKKSKKAAAAGSKKQQKQAKNKNKKGNNKRGSKNDEDEEDEELDLGGRAAVADEDEDKPDDDGAMDSDFEFMLDGTADFRDEDFEGWGFDGATKAGVKGGDKKAVDLNEIIRKRRVKKGEVVDEPENGADAAKEDDEEDEDEVEIDLDDDDDEVLAADGFGMGADSADESGEDALEEGDEDDESDEGAEDDEDEDDEAASDDDSVATPNEHPDDDAQDSDSDDEEDAEEAAKREAFFAPEEAEDKTKSGSASSSFRELYLSRPLLRGLNAVGWTGKPTPIQSKSIPIALEGKDLVGGAVTGSGKTGAFVLPILERLLYRPKKVPTTRVVILTPTRELAIQAHAVATKLASYTDIKFCLAVGGLSLKVQEAELRLRPDVIIATPGRFIDHMRNSASFSTDRVEILVLDEADRMLEDGFADELNEILTTLPKSRQTMLFSATMTSSVDRLIRVGMNKPVRVMVDSQKKTVDKLEQKFVRLRPGREDKRMGYLVHICKTMHSERVIIFFRQKKEAHRARIIFGLLGMSCAELHGSMNQAQRISSVEEFRDGKVSFLLATDLASRGLDIKGIDTVINYEAPQSVEIYIHRIGRTARAGRSGVAVTLAAEPDRKVVKAAVKAAKAQNAKISSVVIDPTDADKWQDKVDEMEEEIESIMVEEKEEKQLANVEMQIKKGENLMAHEEEIKGRPKRTWFETQHDKQKAKDAGRAELNGLKESLKAKGKKLSNKDRKKLDAKTDRAEGRAWKKGSAERAGKGAVLNFKKDKSAKGAKGKPKGKKR